MSKDKNNKTSFVTIPKRLEVTKSKAEGIISYDLDNLYPQRMKLLASASVTATACLDLFKKYISGQGFEDASFGASILNAQDDSADEILQDMSQDYADYGGICLHFDYNGLLEIVNVRVVPFEYARLAHPDSDHAGKIAIYPDWEASTGKIEKKLIQYVDRFTTNQELIMKQISLAGGIDRWNGHVLWWSNRQRKYPIPVYDPAISDIETDAEISYFKKNNAKTSFLASHFFLYKGEFENELDEQKYIENLEKFQGGQEAGKFMFISNVTEENKPELIKVDVANNDRLFEYHETSCQNQIRKSFLAPRELIGEEQSTGFDTDRISQARSYYNSITQFNRDDISKIFSKFMPYFMNEVNVSGNYKIKALYSDEQPNQQV